MKLEQAKAIAAELVEILRPGCIRIEIAGSVRRGKPEPGDIELVAIPDASRRPRPQFGKPASKTVLDALLADLQATGRLGRIKGGDRYKQFRLREGVNLDLFLVLAPAQWGVIFTIRTGPWDYSKLLVTQKKFGGLLPNPLRVQDGGVYDQAGLIETPEEEDFFSLLELEWVPPGERSVETACRQTSPDHVLAGAGGLPFADLPDVAEWLRNYPQSLHITGRIINV